MSPWRPENIAHLAESALRFLELVQENNVSSEQDASGEEVEETLHPNENYDSGRNGGGGGGCVAALAGGVAGGRVPLTDLRRPQSCRRCTSWCSRRW